VIEETMLLIISQAGDLHSDWVEAECDRRGVPYLRLCPRDFPQTLQLTLDLQGEALRGCFRLPGRQVSIDSLSGIWYRRPEPPAPHPDLDEAFARLVTQESQAVLHGLYRALWDRRWVNPPHADAAASFKVNQLCLAQAVGLKTPRTIVTNDPSEAAAFFDACGKQMVYKLLYPLQWEDSDRIAYGVYTTLITPEALAAHLESVRVAPCQFQELIPKHYELRLNVVGEHVWAAAIYSQEADHTRLDYRYDTEGCRHAPAAIPRALEETCLTLARRMGLRMCNIDLIVTPEGDYVFLEVNPNGQWAWIEDYTGLPLTQALVDELLGVETLAGHPHLQR
jgi:glutathione synthase/RimK-type ligase-like ATP-grasp enzyme